MGGLVLRCFLILVLVIASLSCNQAVFAQSPKAADTAKLEPAASTASTYDQDSSDGAADESQSGDASSSSSSSSSREPKAAKDKLPNLRALLNIIANAAEILGLVLGVPACLLVPVGLFFVWQKSKRWYGLAMILFGPTLVIVAVAIPGLVDLLFNAVVDAAKFD
ncbi:MAG: hypothetical protein QG574_3344 [Cyanobacteriota bacterium erpe_2018_sw_21hr_WHONDRS-SW48-000092_B_bin.40]|nr:hypothetical protein [Cyanobacteriota bacterium erpe_2018_sw_21hr_WHONDRS-SW48-000092_B_bin.40]